MLSNYSYTADGGLFLYFLNFSGQPSFYTELQKVVSLNKKRQCSPPEANQLSPLAIDCLTYTNPKIPFSSMVLQDRTSWVGKPQKYQISFNQTFKKGPRGPFFFTDSLEASGYWWPGAKCLVERLLYSVRAPKRCRGVSTELTHLYH